MKVNYCAGEQGRVVLDILRADGDDDNIVFVDDDQSLHHDSIDGVSVIGGQTKLAEFSTETARCLVAFGDKPGARLELAGEISNMGYNFFNAIHPSSSVSHSTTLGEGITVNGESYIGPHVRLDDHVLIDSCVNVSHECTLDTGATITPGVTLAGGVSVGTDVYIGPGATVIEDTTIGDNAVIGAGAVVTEDVRKETTVVGVPAEPIDP